VSRDEEGTFSDADLARGVAKLNAAREAAGMPAVPWGQADAHPSPEVLDELAEVGERARDLARRAAADPLRQSEDAFTVRHCAEWCETVGIGAEWVPVMVAELADDGPDSALASPTASRSVSVNHPPTQQETPAMHATDVVAYTYRADIYCPECILGQLPTGPGETFDGWADCTDMAPEDNLSELAAAFGIDRMDEYTFDSGDFPKVVFASQVEADEFCGDCGRELS